MTQRDEDIDYTADNEREGDDYVCIRDLMRYAARQYLRHKQRQGGLHAPPPGFVKNPNDPAQVVEYWAAVMVETFDDCGPLEPHMVDAIRRAA